MIVRKMTCVLSVVCLLFGLSGPAQSGIIDPDFLGERIAPDSTVVGIVWLRDQPQYELSRQVRAGFDVRLEELAREVQAAGGGETPLGEEILKQIDALTTERAAQMARAIRAAIGPGQEAAQAQIEQIGGKVHARLTVINGLIARFPFGKLGQIADLPMVSYADGSWYEWTGTSHAAPHVAGAVLLLRQKTGLSNTMALKAVLINSADDSTGAGDPAGWDKAYGWGYVNLQKAYQDSRWYYVHSINQGQTRRYKVAMDTGDKVTLVWNKHVAWNGPNPPTSVYPISHLALYLKTYPGGSLVASDTTDTSGVLQVKWTDSPDTAYVDVKAKSIGGPSVGDSYALAACDSIIYVGLAKPVLARGEMPREMVLAQNFPNPFNPVTVIRFELPYSSEAKLSIYNTAGQLVRRLAEGTYERGVHRLEWDSKDERGVDVASGIYFYRLEAGEVVHTRRMVLLR